MLVVEGDRLETEAKGGVSGADPMTGPGGLGLGGFALEAAACRCATASVGGEGGGRAAVVVCRVR